MSQAQTAVASESSLSQSVVKAVAEAKGSDPLDLKPPLYEAIDPDALENIFVTTPTNGRMKGQVTFFYSGYEVTIYGDRYISVEEKINN